jgi:hypothetical protein
VVRRERATAQPMGERRVDAQRSSCYVLCARKGSPLTAVEEPQPLFPFQVAGAFSFVITWPRDQSSWGLFVYRAMAGWLVADARVR